VHRRTRLVPLADPELRLALGAETGHLLELEDDLVPERLQRLDVEALARRVVAHVDDHVVDHSTRFRSFTVGPSIMRPSPVYREPWQGQSHVRSAGFQATMHRRC
jgi:hypothetical protein